MSQFVRHGPLFLERGSLASYIDTQNAFPSVHSAAGPLCSKYSVFQNKNGFLFRKHLNMIITVVYYDSRRCFVIFVR
jgi:hypothetical protein